MVQAAADAFGKLTTYLCAPIFCLVALSCADTTNRVVSEPSTRRDSLGIEIVENPEFAPDTLGWMLDSTARLTIGDEARGDAYIFTHVAAIKRFSDGRIVVGEGRRGGLGIRVFDSLGTHLQNIGRAGNGPGEYASIRDLYMLPGDTLVAASIYDEGPLIYYDGRGNHVRTVRRVTFPPDADLGRFSITNVRGTFDDGTLLVIRGWQPGWAGAASRRLSPGEPHMFTDTGKLVRANPNAEPYIVFDVVPRERGVYFARTFPESGFLDGYILAQPSFAIRGMRAFVASGDRFEIREYAADGALVRIIRKQHVPVPISRAWADSVTRVTRAALARFPDFRWIADAPSPEPPRHAPAIDRLVVDDAGNLWVHTNQRGRSPAEPIWFVFDSTGALTHSLRADIPSIVHIGRDAVLGVVRDSLDVPAIVVRSLVKR